LPAISGKVLWLLTDNSREPYFYNTISYYSAALNAPLFTPHVTLGRIPDKNMDELLRIVNKLADDFHSFTVGIRDLECRTEPYQKLVLTLNPETTFHSICKEADRCLGGNYSKQNDPHISLLYSHLDCNQIIDKEITARKNIPESAEIFGIALVELQGRPEDWKILVQRNF